MRYTIVIIGSICAFLVTPVLAKQPLHYHHRHLTEVTTTNTTNKPFMIEKRRVIILRAPAVDGTSLTLTSSQEHLLYLRNLHDSGYDPRHDVGPSGNVSDPGNW